MNDIIKSGILGLVLVGTLIAAAPILNENDDDTKIVEAENLEVTQDKDIHIPL